MARAVCSSAPLSGAAPFLDVVMSDEVLVRFVALPIEFGGMKAPFTVEKRLDSDEMSPQC